MLGQQGLQLPAACSTPCFLLPHVTRPLLTASLSLPPPLQSATVFGESGVTNLPAAVDKLREMGVEVTVARTPAALYEAELRHGLGGFQHDASPAVVLQQRPERRVGEGKQLLRYAEAAEAAAARGIEFAFAPAGRALI